jgi:hypothetical protein
MIVETLPFWGRITVVESVVDAEQTPSGLIVPPAAFAGSVDDGKPARRGIVKAIDADIFREGTAERACADKITPGVLVYFRNPKRLHGELLAVDLADILAYEP